MAIPPVSGTPGGGMPPPGGFTWAYFYALAGQFWAAIEREEALVARQILARIEAYIAQTGALRVVAGAMARMTAAIEALELALASAAGGGAAEAGGAFFLGEGGIIIVVVIFVLYAFRASSQPVYAEGMPGGGGSTGWPVRSQAHPVYTPEQLRRLIEQPASNWQTLIVKPLPQDAQRRNALAARILLERLRRERRPASGR